MNTHNPYVAPSSPIPVSRVRSRGARVACAVGYVLLIVALLLAISLGVVVWIGVSSSTGHVANGIAVAIVIFVFAILPMFGLGAWLVTRFGAARTAPSPTGASQ